MNQRDLFLLSPEISLVVLAFVVILLDLVVQRKGVLASLAILGLVVPLALSAALWAEVQGAPAGREAGIFGTLVVDKFSLFFKFLVLAITALVMMSSVDYVARFRRFQGEYYGLMLLSASGMMLLASTTELISIYVALELTTLPLAALAAFLRDERAGEAGIKFLLLGAVSSAILLYGMAFVYGLAGSTYLSEIAVAVQAAAAAGVPFGSYALFLGIVLIVAGFGFKIASVPFQMWVPDVYEGAPTPITAYLSVASKAAGFAVLLRVFYVAFGSVGLEWSALFASLAVASMTVGNLVAMAQQNIKRLLAYSTVAHAGYLLVGLAAVVQSAPQGETWGPRGVLFYLAAYGVTNLAAFFAIIALSHRTGSDLIDDLSGMGRRVPWLGLVMLLALISLIGIPPTAGFMAKLYLFTAAVRSDLTWLALVGVLNSVLSAYYYLRIVRVMYFAGPEASEPAPPTSAVARVALALTAGGIVVLGVMPSPLFDLAESAAAPLLFP